MRRSTPQVLAELKAGGKLSDKTKFALRRSPPSTASANYDGAISNYLSSLAGRRRASAARSRRRRNGRFVKLQDLRYGENPHQQAAFYRDLYPAPGSLVTAKQLQGKELSLQQHRRRRRGLGMRQELRRAGLRDRQARQPLRRGARRGRRRGLRARPSRPIRPRPSAASSPSTGARRRRRARRSRKQFVEVLMAPGYHARGAARCSRARPNVRVLEIALPPGGATTGTTAATRWTSSASARAC